jgi:hypothetical protein
MKSFLPPALRFRVLTAAGSLIFGQAFAAETAPTSTLITGATIFDGSNAAWITGKSVLIMKDGIIYKNTIK